MQLGHISEKGMTTLCKQGALENVKIGKLGFCKYCTYRKQMRTSLLTTSAPCRALLILFCSEEDIADNKEITN
ncbi:Retrovirus-related Pol polyprotein from transposon TNT 1-94 [Gossypium australe]|uniref:Retrovirus-related Pol polyprotein from transposon TNT 1-94 n=1 Tax=Gossypium australe TaxID=47621 RepID=A0A5B6VC19_9ROSI|nr:Retrovirus-related Pol polyprotein from transposon TNT 1-94 [Gossypium australe]